MKRWLTHLTIAAYLGALFYGIACHAFNYNIANHPLKYFIVWDMFCGWSGYEVRTHVVGEGESGTFYELAPGPWGAFTPYGNLPRHHYDSFSSHGVDIAMNTLKHTKHEPISRIYVIEETWSKKFNLPDTVWERWYDDPKDPYSYYYLQAVYNADGYALQRNVNWLSYQTSLCLSDNPRLHADSRKGRPFFTINPMSRDNGTYDPNQAPYNAEMSLVGSRLGN